MGADELLKQYGEEITPEGAEKARLEARLGEVPPPRRPKRSRAVWGAVVMVAMLALVVLRPEAPAPYRGATGVPDAFPEEAGEVPITPIAPDELVVSLRLAAVGPEGAERVTDGAVLSVGDAVIFRVSASLDTPLVVRVEAPDGTTQLADVALQAGQPLDLPWGDLLLQWTFDQPGPHTFTASPDPARCLGGQCAQVTLDIR